MHNISCTLPTVEAEYALNNYGNSTALISTFPPIIIKRESGIGSGNLPSSSLGHDRKILMTPVNEPLTKRLTRIYFEDGLGEALADAEENSGAYPAIQFIVKSTRYLFEKTKQLNALVWPSYQNTNLIEEYSQTRDYKNSPIRYMSWHPKVFKLAIAACDDSVRIYSKDTAHTTVLRNGHQKYITCLAWRPLCASELAVGCYTGIVLWKLDTSSNTLRPASQFQHLKQGNHHPITSVDWNHTGNLLASASISDTDVIVWEVDTGRCVPLKRIGVPCALLKWSPNSSRLCSSTIGNVFRVWNATNWVPERWTTLNGAIQSAAWSPCSSHLVFVVTNETILYRLCFVDDQLYQTTTAPKQSFPIADFSKVNCGPNEVGGIPQSICWDPHGKYIAVLFKNSPNVAIFSTTIDRITVNISPAFFVTGNRMDDEHASFICFKPNHEKSAQVILTIGWSSGRIQYVPILC